MKTRLLKEVRQLLPAWVAALLLAALPLLLVPVRDGLGLAAAAFVVGLVLLSVSSFGREFSQRTFALFVVQPVSRERLWGEKVSVLAAGIVTVTCAFVLVLFYRIPEGPSKVVQEWGTLFAVSPALAAFAGGLCLTLALRQVLAAIFLTILLPLGLVAAVALVGGKWFPDTEGEVGLICYQIALLAYAVFMYGLARILFLRAQDAQWTGGNVTLPSALKWLPGIRTATTFRTTHPLRALCWKELQFQQVSFLLTGLLLVFSIAMLALPKIVDIPEDSAFWQISAVAWALWLVIPLLVGCNAVAEERKLGTLEPQLCLPVSRVRQFAMKTLATLGCGLALGALLPLLLALTAWCLGLITGRSLATWDIEDTQGVLLACAGIMFITLVALYASTLTRHLLQAFGATIAMIALVPSLGALAELVATQLSGDEARDRWMLHYTLLFWGLGPFVVLIFVMSYTWSRLRWLWTSLTAVLLLTLLLGGVKWHSYYGNSSEVEGLWVFGSRLSGSSVFALSVAPIALLLLVLAYRNFRHTQTSGRLWLRNAGTWAACLLTTAIVTTLVYHRPWEFAMPFEPPAGPPRLSGSVRPEIAFTSVDSPTFVLLPDGRLCSYKGYERIPLPITQAITNQSREPEFTWREIKHPRVEFIGGSNWLSIAATRRELIGVKSDGSLWNSYWLEWTNKDGQAGPIRSFAPRPKDTKSRPTSVQLERIGDGSDWMTVAGGGSHFVALKRDGTIWGWGDNRRKQLGEGPEEFTNAPVQISKDSDWTAVFASYEHTIAVKRDGSIWKWGRVTKDLGKRIINEDGLVKLNLNVPGVRTVISRDEWDLILDTEGNLWGLGHIPRRVLGRGEAVTLHTTAQKFGGSNWTDVHCLWGERLVGLRNDGSLWSGIGDDDYGELASPAFRLGKRTDWLAATPEWGPVVALAKDGTVCRFGNWFQSDLDFLLAPTRRCTWSVSVLDSAK